MNIIFDIGLVHYLILSSIIFCVGITGVVVYCRSIINFLFAIELMLLSVNINFVAFSAYLQSISGQIFSIFILTIAAAETALALAIVVLYFRSKHSIDVKSMDQLKY